MAGRYRSWSGVCPVTTIQGGLALVTPHFAYLRVFGESSELLEDEGAFTVTFPGKAKVK